ncbi:MAG: CoA-transferase [Nocardioides sp.]|uniref:CoA transferase subunit A n=1 Tax=Nocardioides sp. TaxID=35761 RepID=UPI0039E4C08E
MTASAEAQSTGPGRPTRTSKLTSIEDAAALIGDGTTLALGGIHAHNGPMALIREIIRQGPRELTLIPNVSAGMPAELLIAANLVKTVYACYVGLEHHGLAPAFRKAGQERTIEIRDSDEPFQVYGMKAGAATLPFMPFPFGHEAVDVTRLNPDDYRTVTDPFTGREVVVCRPLQADFGLIHVQKADVYGNVQIEGSVVGDSLIARSSTHVIVTAEEIIPLEETQRNPKLTTIPGFFVDSVVHAPYGAHPTSSHGRYRTDEDHIEIYKALGAEAYLDEWIRQRPTNDDYLDKVGARQLISLLEGMSNHGN